jgi:type IV secretory pathway TrbL component
MFANQQNGLMIKFAMQVLRAIIIVLFVMLNDSRDLAEGTVESREFYNIVRIKSQLMF